MRLPVLAIALLGSTALLTPSRAQAPAPAGVADCDRLVSVLGERGPGAPGVTLTREQAETFRRESNDQACRDALTRLDQTGTDVATATASPAGGAESGRIVVQQPAASVQVQQGTPQVTVQQAQPNVTVRQPLPEIIVRQSPPVIRVEQAPPEIIVRMPEPDVSVATAQPQVQVIMPPPQVQIVQAPQPQIQVQPAQPNVQIQPLAGQMQPNIQIQQAQTPNVRFERTGEPQIAYQPQGQPQIRFERPDGSPIANGQAATGTATAGQPTVIAPAAQAVAQAAPLVANPHAGVGPAAAPLQNRQITVADMVGTEVVNARGERLGTVKRFARGGADGAVHVVVAHGGFLGLGEKEIALPLGEMVLHADKLMTRESLTDEQIRAMPAFDENASGMRELARGDRAPLTVAAIPPASDQGPATGTGRTQAAYGTAAPNPGVSETNAQAQLNGVPSRPAAGSTEVRTTGAVPGPVQAMPVERLTDMSVYNLKGEQLGEVEEILAGIGDGKGYLVVAAGGFLGIGERRFVLPMDHLALREDRLVTLLGDDMLRILPSYKENDRIFRVLADGETAQVARASP